MLNRMVEARFCLLRAQVLKSIGMAEEAENETSSAYEHAHGIGINAYFSNAAMPVLFNQEQTLAQAWRDGKEDAHSQEAFREEWQASNGSQEEWDALSFDEKADQWDEFHDLCARGIGDQMYFYQVMMNRHLVGYVGH